MQRFTSAATSSLGRAFAVDVWILDVADHGQLTLGVFLDIILLNNSLSFELFDVLKPSFSLAWMTK